MRRLAIELAGGELAEVVPAGLTAPRLELAIGEGGELVLNVTSEDRLFLPRLRAALPGPATVSFATHR